MQVREPQQERGFHRRDSVLEGAASVFDRYGYGQSSLKQITESSGATTGSVYFYYPTKESIALAVITEQNRRTLGAFDEIAQTCSGVETLIRASHVIADALLTDVVVRAGIRLSLEQGTLSTPTADYYRTWIAGLVPPLQQARDAQEIASPLTLPQLAGTIVPYFTGVHLVSNVLTHREDLFESLRVMWDVVLRGVVTTDAQPRLLGVVEELFARAAPEGDRNGHLADSA